MLSKENLAELRHNLAHLSLPAVRDFYEKAYQDCRLIYERSSKSTPDANPCSGVETVVEVALTATRNCVWFSEYSPKRQSRFEEFKR